METLHRVVAPHFVAGFLLDYDTLTVVKAAPIIKYMVGWHEQKVTEYTDKKGWEVQFIYKDTDENNPPL